MARGINAGEERQKRSPRKKLLARIEDWLAIRDDIREAPDRVMTSDGKNVPNPELRELRERRSDIVDAIQTLVAGHPDLRDVAINNGFREDLLPKLSGPPGAGNPGRAEEDERRAEREARQNDDGGPTQNNNNNQNRDNNADRGAPGHGPNWKLPGVKGKDFVVRRGPNGQYYAVYTLEFKGNKVPIAVRVSKDDIQKYGIKQGEGKQLTKQQFRRIEVLGSADEMTFHGEDRNPFKGLIRSLTRSYKGTELLQDDEVMAVFLGQHIMGWGASEVQNELRNTKWYKNSTAYQRSWQLDNKKAERQSVITNVRGQMLDWLEDNYGLGWQKYVKPSQVREWAKTVAAGQWGTTGNADDGLTAWQRRMFDKAAELTDANGNPIMTPARMQRESEAEEVNRFANRPEEMFERLRSEALAWLGYDPNNTPKIDRSTLQQWAGQLVTGEKSEGDWARYLRQQMKSLYPYFDPNLSFQEQATAYKSIAERLMGDTIDWSDKLLRDFSKTNAKGEQVGAMSLYEFEKKVRQDQRAWKQGTQLWDEGTQFTDILLNKMLGVS